MVMKDKGHHHIVGTVKGDKGEITAYKLDNGELLMKEQAVAIAKRGEINGVTVATSKSGEEFLRSLPDEDKSNNLDNLPVVEDVDE